jgi:YMGG-like Gly-zipper
LTAFDEVLRNITEKKFYHTTTTMKLSLQSCSRYGKLAGTLTLITFGLSQCAGTSDGQLAQGQGALLGGAAGALLGNAIGKDTNSTLIGAGIGSLAGYAYGTHIANKKAAYASTEDWLDACIVQAEASRRKASAYNQRLNNQLARLEKEVRSARAAGNRQQLSSLNREIRAERAAAQRESSAYTKDAGLQRSAISEAGGKGGSRLKSLRSSTSGIETQVSTMNRNVQRFAALESQTDV